MYIYRSFAAATYHSVSPKRRTVRDLVVRELIYKVVNQQAGEVVDLEA